MMPGPWQILLIVVLILLLFGAGKLPRIMGDVAKGIKSFKKGMKDTDADEDSGSQNEAPRHISQHVSTEDDEALNSGVSDKEKHK